MSHCNKCGHTSFGYHFLIGDTYWCNRCLDAEMERAKQKFAEIGQESEIDSLRAQLAAAEAERDKLASMIVCPKCGYKPGAAGGGG